MGRPPHGADLTSLYARNGQTEKALEQIDAMRRLNFAGRLDSQISTLETLTEQGKRQTTNGPASSP